MDRAAATDFDVRALDAFLRARFGGDGALSIERATGGMSNPTFFVSFGANEFVLRKQPPSVLMPSAHAIDREYRVLQALRGSAVPVPEPIHYCEDRNIVGTPFYLMQRLQGRLIVDYAMPGIAADERRALFDAMGATMAAIHRVDYSAIGLAEFGRPGNYFARQLARWSKQWQQFRSGDDDNPALDRMVAWLDAHLPISEKLALCHGDFRIGNMMFHASEPRVIGVFDWELSTLGHPLVDVAFNTQAWRMAPDENGGLLGVDLGQMGIPSEQDYLERYYRLAGSAERMTTFHQVFAMFRGAVGSASVASRGRGGNAVLADAAAVGDKLARAYAMRGMQLIEGG